MVTKKFTEDFLTLRGQEIKVKVGFLPVANLRYFSENPRIYSILKSGESEPSQEEIEGRLQGMDHVKQLFHSIKSNGGLHDPIIVKNNTVLEGNSRLAAYRLLLKKEADVLRWGKIKCKVLPDDISESLVFSLLGEYHLIGKTDWAPFEQAGYLYRRHYVHKIAIEEIVKESTLKRRDVVHKINVYKFMVDHDQDDVSKWSYYDEYLKSRYIAKCRTEYPTFDDIIIEKINTNEIGRAAEIRDNLKIIAQSQKNNIDKFVNGERDFETCYEIAISQGHGDGHYKRLNKFRQWVCDLEFEKNLDHLEESIRSRCQFEIKKIHKKLSKIVSSMST